MLSKFNEDVIYGILIKTDQKRLFKCTFYVNIDNEIKSPEILHLFSEIERWLPLTM